MKDADVILILGPSGIGKTTALKHFNSRVKSVKAISLDNIVHRHARESGLIDRKDNLNALITTLGKDRDKLFEFGVDVLAQYCDQLGDHPIIVDVGTGFLDSSLSLGWITSYPAISVTAEPDKAFDRFRKARQLDISYEQYLATQFSRARVQLYDMASVVLKTDDLSEEAVAHRFACSIMGLLPNSVSQTALQEWLL